MPQKGDGHCRQVAKEARQGATLPGKHEVGVAQKEPDGSGLSQTGTEKTLPKQKDSQLRRKAIDRGKGKREQCWDLLGYRPKKGEPPFFFNRQTGFRCLHRLPRRPPKRGTFGKACRHMWDKTLPAKMANNKPKSLSGSSFCIWSKWTSTWP